MHNTVSRLVLFSVVLLLHVAMLMVRWPRVVNDSIKDERSLTWVNIEPRAKESPAEPVLHAPPLEQVSLGRPLLVPAPLGISEPTADWRARLEASVSSAVSEIVRQQSFRQLGPSDLDERTSSPPEFIFEEPPREAGDIDQDSVQGRVVVWHSEHWYTELKFPTIKDPNAPVSSMNPPKWMSQLGKRRARGNLFDCIKELVTECPTASDWEADE